MGNVIKKWVNAFSFYWYLKYLPEEVDMPIDAETPPLGLGV